MLGRAALSGRSQAHAYLMLLRMEVAAFHPAELHNMLCAVRFHRIGVVRSTHPTDSSLWPYSSVLRTGCADALSGRPLAAILPWGVRTFLDGRTHRDCLEHH